MDAALSHIVNPNATEGNEVGESTWTVLSIKKPKSLQGVWSPFRKGKQRNDDKNKKKNNNKEERKKWRKEWRKEERIKKKERKKNRENERRKKDR